MSNLTTLIRVKLLERFQRELKRLEHSNLEMPNEELKLSIEFHKEIINYILRRLP